MIELAKTKNVIKDHLIYFSYKLEIKKEMNEYW